MTIKRLFLILLTILSLAGVGLSLIDSLNQPQVQSRLELYQSNLILNASEFESAQIEASRNALLGKNPDVTAKKQYQAAREQANTNLNKLKTELQAANTDVELGEKWQKAIAGIATEQKFINDLDLKLGIIEANQGEIDQALHIWNELIIRLEAEKQEREIFTTAKVLKGLWSQPPQILPHAESAIKTNLQGWFQYSALKQVYQLEERQDDLLNLQAEEQKKATSAIWKLTLIGVIPFFGGIIGICLLLFFLTQLFFGKEKALLATDNNIPWEVPWDGEIVWQVLIVGFFFLSQILLPFLFGISGFNPTGLSLRLQAFYVLVSYLLMAGGGLLVLYFSIKSFFPLPPDWFQFKWRSNWIFWGVGGYFVALPLVVIVSLINQQIWQGQGGSNPLLMLALQAQDQVVLGIFFFTASVAAPIFEETIFRGFLLPSLTRYFPVWGAILASSLVFSFAHLSFSEVLPLTTLGFVLGFVYSRSRNLLASILLHSLWNSGTLLSLFVLGSG
ncbi:MAG: CPBP family intramembrane metalloprotease [Gomphosphaeria aponina SAG 52.96 = DSM 107014]|uniref:CPBP family intramembrane metalloprotease n=1 Tax=Gomphosphaeria aponina SAG 52.96 = DSM 107014 TaxID=1521640 RepID=A0A941GNW1_9CHRO|nr:CPBP family intramembrane metalloprotease [Gomphosphaeria aponina SAG 52.96 = DSM 107014]